LVPGTRFGRYDIIRLVGTGGMGHVYEAILSDLHKRVALKIMLPEGSRVDEERRARFVREARAAARVRHPNVVEIFDVGLNDDVPFLAMEFLEGVDLRAMFKQGPLAPEALLETFLPVVAAVRAAHEAQVIHRDLKPENIFISVEANGETRPMVVDFGISKVTDPSQQNMTATAMIMGTPLYMSPEQARSARDIDGRTDQYALAVMLYEGLGGRCPFDAQSLYALMLQKAEGRVTELRKLRPGLPEPLYAVIERAMSVDRQARFGDVGELGAALLPFASDRSRLLYGSWFGQRPLAAAASEARAAQVPSVPAGPSSRTPASGSARPPEPSAADDVGRSDSTLRASAHEITGRARIPRPRSRRLLVGAAAAAAVIAGVVISLGGRNGSEPEASHEPPATEPSASEPKRAPSEPDRPTVPASTSAAAVLPASRPVTAAPVEMFTFKLAIRPAHAKVELDDAPLGDLTDPQVLPRDGKRHRLRVSAPGYAPQELSFTNAPPPETITLLPLAAAKPQVTTEAPKPPKPVTRAPPSRAPQPPAPAPTKRVTSNNAPILY
jgi:serine/threonine-protein kinase